MHLNTDELHLSKTLFHKTEKVVNYVRYLIYSKSICSTALFQTHLLNQSFVDISQYTC